MVDSLKNNKNLNLIMGSGYMCLCW